jgi:hypothetical protein
MSDLLQFVIVAGFGALCFGCGYLVAFIVTRNKWRDETIKHGVARYNWHTGKWEWGEPPEGAQIDLVGLTTLFVDVFGESTGWTEPRAVRINDAQEPVVRDLEKAGHRLLWSRQELLRQRKLDGWKPVFERDAIGRPTIFLDRRGETVLLHHAPE